jgi:hypothetical protein
MRFHRKMMRNDEHNMRPRAMRPVTDDIFSQAPEQDSSYMLDSFVVSDEHVSFCMQKQPKKPSKSVKKVAQSKKKNKFKRIRKLNDSSTIICVSSNDEANQSDKENCVELVDSDDADQVQVIRKRGKNLIMDSYCEEAPRVDIVQPRGNNYVPITNPGSNFYQHSLLIIDEEQENAKQDLKKHEIEKREEENDVSDVSEDELNKFLSEFEFKNGVDTNKTAEIQVDTRDDGKRDSSKRQENTCEILIDDDNDDDEDFNKWVVEDTFLDHLEHQSASSKLHFSHQQIEKLPQSTHLSVGNQKNNFAIHDKIQPTERKHSTAEKPIIKNSINPATNQEASSKCTKTNSNVLIVDTSLLTSAAVSKRVLRVDKNKPVLKKKNKIKKTQGHYKAFETSLGSGQDNISIGY